MEAKFNIVQQFISLDVFFSCFFILLHFWICAKGSESVIQLSIPFEPIKDSTNDILEVPVSQVLLTRPRTVFFSKFDRANSDVLWCNCVLLYFFVYPTFLSHHSAIGGRELATQIFCSEESAKPTNLE